MKAKQIHQEKSYTESNCKKIFLLQVIYQWFHQIKNDRKQEIVSLSNKEAISYCKFQIVVQ